jgi:signal transduction histidine kinase
VTTVRIGRLSLRWRVAVAFGLGSLLITGILAVTTWNLTSGYMQDQREESAVAQAEVNVRLVDGAIRRGSGGLGDLLTGLTTDSDSSVLLERATGWLTSGRQVGPSLLPAPLLALGRRGIPARQRLVVDGVPVLAVTLPVPSDHSTYVELFPLTQIDRAFRYISAVLIAGVAASTLLGVAVGLWTSKRALRPLTELTRAASRVAGGDLQARLPTQDDPDLAPLATTFNRTAEELEYRVRQDSRFAGDVSHELRSPLTTMANAAAVLDRRRDEMTGTAGRAVELLLAEVTRFQRMVVDLLEISRDDQIDGAAVETVDLGELVDRVTRARPNPCPLIDIDTAAPSVQGDRRRLDRVVANLLDNAEKYAGGPVRVAVLPAAAGTRIEVDDAGPGIPPELRRQVFERFARGAQAGRRGDDSGSGLGLALVTRHVVRHGGSAWVEDRPGGGSRFVVELPAGAS